MASSGSNQACTLCDKIGLKPFTKENIFKYYIPATSVASYTSLAVNVMNPNLLTKVMPKKDMTNVLLLSTLVGTSFYIYHRQHLQSLPTNRRIIYSLLGSSLFSLGSVLVWAIIRSALPKNNNGLATFAGLASGAVLVKLSTDYFNDCDKLAKN